MLRNIISDKIRNEVWHSEYFEICKLRLSSDAYKIMIEEINKIIDEKLETNTKLIVSQIFPTKSYTNTIWEEAYTQACAHDEGYAAQFIGLLVCQELIAREETWYYLKDNLSSNMVYFIK